jgi:hypothetical protein
LYFDKIAKDLGEIPLSRELILELLKDYKRPNDKISEWIKNGELISLRRGLYIPGPKSDIEKPEPFLIANHLYGPSYVSLESALSYWGLIPERVYEITSVTLKSKKIYNTPIGKFSYQFLPSPYYSFGIKSVPFNNKQTILIASLEKAICDKLILTSGINLRSVKQTKDLLIEDLRMDETLLKKVNVKTISSWLKDSPKKNSIKILIKTLNYL